MTVGFLVELGLLKGLGALDLAWPFLLGRRTGLFLLPAQDACGYFPALQFAR